MTCSAPDFRQNLPKPADDLVLVEGNKFTGSLRYRDPETDQTYTVPNIWYNQTVAQRAAAMRWYADRRRDCVVKLTRDNEMFPSRFTEHQIAEAKATAEHLDLLALEMERTGKVLA